MGLDWNPAYRARAGRELEFAAAKSALTQVLARSPLQAWFTDALATRFNIGRTASQRQADFDAVAITPYETLQAPRVGSDAEATNWARTEYDRLTIKPMSLDAYLQKMQGYYVLALVAECDGLPVYSNGDAYSGIDLYSFRGQFLKDCTKCLGKKLINEAWEEREAPALLGYAKALLSAAQSFAEQHATTEWLTRREPPETDDGAAHETHVAASAARWCRFWAERGHGLEPYY